MGTPTNQETGRSLSPDEGLGRSYECTFCKRGFTNAQALGGHMNIHRKDKAKAKSKSKSKSKAKQNNAFTTSTKGHDLSVPSESFKIIPTESSIGFAPSNPNSPWSLSADNHLRVNLNLGIGTSEVKNSNTKDGQEDWFENQVDLELRLGHYP